MADLLNKVGTIFPSDLHHTKTTTTKPTNTGFADMLKDALDNTNILQEKKEKATVDIATGQVKDLHQAALAIEKAEVSMKLMTEVRNKAVSAYKELLRTQM